MRDHWRGGGAEQRDQRDRRDPKARQTAEQPGELAHAASKVSATDEALLERLLWSGNATALAPCKVTLFAAALARARAASSMSAPAALAYAAWLLQARRDGNDAMEHGLSEASVSPAPPAAGHHVRRGLARSWTTEEPQWGNATAPGLQKVQARQAAAVPVLFLARHPRASERGEPSLLGKLAARPSTAGLVDPEQLDGELALEQALALVRSDGEGEPLSAAVRQAMEADLGKVSDGARLHTSAAAAEAARLLGAQAFTIGLHVYFAAGQYAPDTADGVRLLRHELTHVAQHERGELALQGRAEVLAPSSVQEAEAHAAETRSSGATRASGKLASASARALDGGGISSAGAMREPASGSAAVALRPGDEPMSVPAGGKDVNKVGIVAWAGAPALRLRSAPSTGAGKVLSELAFNTRLQVIKEFPGKWYFVSTQAGQLGYVARDHIKTNLPEPGAKLHKVEAGPPGFAISIAEQYFGKYADDWGQDLRFYVNVLAWVNKRPVPDSTSGWKSLQFRAGEMIWIPTMTFARGLRGVVNSGSRSYNALDAVGLAGFLERAGELWADVSSAVSLSMKYLPAAIRRHVEEALWSILEAMAMLLVGAAAVLAISTALGAAIGALAGGAGAAPGAAAGFEVGMVLLNWLGLGFLAVWIGQSLVKVGSAFGKFLGQIWNARGDATKVDAAARQFAEAIGVLCGVLLEALVMWAASIGASKAMGILRGTRFGKGFQSSAAGEWLARRVDAVKGGKTKIPTPKDAWSKFSWNRTSTAQRLLKLFGDAASEHFRPIEPNKVSIHGELKISGRALDALSDADLIKLVELCKTKGPPDAYTYFESSSTNGGKPGARLRFESRLQARARTVVQGILDSLGIKAGDARAKLFENLSEGDKIRLWDLFNEQAFKNPQLRQQAAEWAFGKKPRTVRELVAQMQFFEAEVSRQGEVLFKRLVEREVQLRTTEQSRLGRSLTDSEIRDITRRLTQQELGRSLDVLGDAAKRACKEKAMVDRSTRVAADGAWRMNVDAQQARTSAGVTKLGQWNDATLPEKVQASSEQLGFASEADGAYHAHKHARELGTQTSAATEMTIYLQEARALIRGNRGFVRHNQNGTRSVIVEAGGMRVIVTVSSEGGASIATFGKAQ